MNASATSDGEARLVRLGGHAATDRADRYIHQLLSHLGQRLHTSSEGDVARIEAPYGWCQLHARDDGIALLAAGADHDSAAHVADVVSRHLERFGAPVTWEEQASVA